MLNNLANLRRELTKQSISINPVDITIQRTEKVRQGGGYVDTPSIVGPYTVRIFMTSHNRDGRKTDVAGTKQDDQWGLLADYMADIRAGSNVEDRFDIPGVGKFKVMAVYPQTVNAQIVGFQATIELVH